MRKNEKSAQMKLVPKYRIYDDDDDAAAALGDEDQGANWYWKKTYQSIGNGVLFNTF